MHVVLSVLLFSAGYYAGGIVGILLGFPPSGIAAIWPSTAILLAALLLTPPRHWWIYLLAAVPTHLHLVANFQRPEVPFVVMLCQVASNAAHAVLAALAVRFLIGAPPRFDSLRNMAAFILLAGIMATAVACVLAVSLFLLTGWATDFWLAWRQRVLANVFPVITIPPVIVLTLAGQLVGAQQASRRSYAELGLLTMGLLAVGIPVFGWESSALRTVPALLLAPLPFLLWAAVRLGTGALSLSLLVVAGMSLASASP
jgi:integral membrane sensor domain MASE1